MPYTLDKDGNPFLDENGNKLEFSISYTDTNDWYKHREGIHINDNGHLDTEVRYLIVKDAMQDNHAVSKKQLNEINNNIYSKLDIDNKLLTLQNSINASFNSLKSQIQLLETKISSQMPGFVNKPLSNNQFNPNSN